MESCKKIAPWLKTSRVGNSIDHSLVKMRNHLRAKSESMKSLLVLGANLAVAINLIYIHSVVAATPPVVNNNMSVSVNRYGDVSIVGDAMNNNIKIERISDTVARLSGSGTKINNSYNYFEFDPNHNVSIALNGGPDTVTLQGTSIAAPLKFASITIQGGDGTDRFTINNVYTTGAMSLDMGGGVSTVDEEFARISGTNVGSFSFRTDRTAPTTFGAAGHDNLYLTSCTIRGDATLTGGNALNEFYFNSTLVQGNAQVIMGGETNKTTFMTDYFATSNCKIVGTLSVNTGEGWGRVNLNNTNAGTITVTQGTSGSDEVWLYNVTARIGSFDGGSGGADVIQGTGNHFTSSLQIKNIEKNTLQWKNS